jgi:ABC-type nitrate/sulfonate/bicarbonate transport system substrate-binding protein
MTGHRALQLFLSPATAIAFAIAAVSAGSIPLPAVAQPVGQIKFGGQFPPIFEYVYRHYALDDGFLEKQGLRAEFVGFSAGLTGIQALASGSVDFACEGVGSFLTAIQAGADLKIVFVPNANNSYVRIAPAAKSLVRSPPSSLVRRPGARRRSSCCAAASSR